ncbi:MAG TPA: ABC transporter substrate-binding protein [Gammaproteobacteria bacterium]|nr:ABC transporter substrate-binding protein [Gammaproteobacteria bacterium]
MPGRAASFARAGVLAAATAFVAAAVLVAAATLRPSPAATKAPSLAPPPVAADGTPLPTVASMNVCTDQLVLALADDAQIRTLSWLSADPEESLLAARAAQFPLNYGTAEEVLRFDPDVVVAGTFTSAFARSLLERLGYRVVEMAPAESVDDIAADIRRVADALSQRARGEAAVAALRRSEAALERAAGARKVGAVVLRPGGFTVGRGSLADDLMALAGLDNLAADRGLDRWGSLSIETLVRSAPELLILASYRSQEPSLANAVFDHPAIERLEARADSLVIPGAAWSCGLPQSLDSAAAMQRAARRADAHASR